MNFLKYKYYLTESDQEISDLEKQYRASPEPMVARKLKSAYKRMGIDDRIAQLDRWDAIEPDDFFIEMLDPTQPTPLLGAEVRPVRFFWHDIDAAMFGERAVKAALLALRDIAQVPSKILEYITAWKTSVANNQTYSKTIPPWVPKVVGYRPQPNGMDAIYSEGLSRLAKVPLLAVTYSELIKPEIGQAKTWSPKTPYGKMALVNIRTTPELLEKYLNIETSGQSPERAERLLQTIESLR